MSKHSKAKRDKKRKQQGKRPYQRLVRDVPAQNHAVMQDETGRVVAAIGLQGAEWQLSLGGQTLGGGDDPAPMLAMLMHLQKTQQQEGKVVTLDYSAQLTQFIEALATKENQTLDEYLAQKVAMFESDDGDDAGDYGEAGQAVTVAQADPAGTSPGT